MAYGFSFYIKGLKWLRAHPGYFCLLFLPTILSFSLLVVLGGFFVKYNDNIIAMIMYTKPEDLLLLALYHLVKTILYVVIGVMSLVFFMLCFNILASPIFVLGDIWSITGFGLWLLIPGGQMVFMPLAVVGGTLLVIENMAEIQTKNQERI
ncbi:MAG: hypothetical protein KA436_11990 [Oligoflexales bacterium]|nr:hypothetical protein [Oligoflexales bacterium]